MTAPAVAVLDYGMGNLRSVQKALERAGADARVAGSPDAVGAADALVVPGVGAFGACMANLAAAGLDRAIVEFAGTGRPVFGVCLGLQVLHEWSEEGGVDGLGLLPGKVRRLSGPVKVPHMGWNDVGWVRRHPYTAGAGDERFYFVHSYGCEPDPETVVGETEHGVRFAAVAARGNLFGTQFHPEKSGPAGLAIYERFVESARGTAS